jgi:surface polysaccharide O-acyltransferase-like enzyme
MEAMLSADVSDRMRALRFPLIVGVVFVHAYRIRIEASHSVSSSHFAGANAAEFTRNVVSQGLAQLAVPFFFLLSGILFFHNYRGTFADYKSKLSRRVHTILVPFLLWNAATVCVFALGESLPATRGFFDYSLWPPVRSFRALDYANALFGLTTKYPMCFQFWFLRDLMVLQVVTPWLYPVLRRNRYAVPLLVLATAAWFSGRWPLLWPSDEATVFYLAGAYLGVAGFDLAALDRWHRFYSVLFLLLLAVASAPPTVVVDDVLHKALILCGIPTVWWYTKVALRHTGTRAWLFRLSASSFLVYAAHEPPLTILRKLMDKWAPPHNSLSEIGWYFAIPCVIIVALVLLSSLLNRRAPALMSLVTGAERRVRSAAA